MHHHRLSLFVALSACATILASCSDDSGKKDCVPRCDGNVMITCIDNMAVDCGLYGEFCQVNEAGEPACVEERSCSMRCDGDTLYMCDANNMQVKTDCAAQGKKCDGEKWACVDPAQDDPKDDPKDDPDTKDECVAGCANGKLTTCDGDVAKVEDCPSGQACDEAGKTCVEVKPKDCVDNGEAVANGEYVCGLSGRTHCVDGTMVPEPCEEETPVCDMKAENHCRAFKSCSLGSLTISHASKACAEDDKIIVECFDGALNEVDKCTDKEICAAQNDGYACKAKPCTEDDRATLCADLIEGKAGMVTYCTDDAEPACAAKCDADNHFVDADGACVCDVANNFIPGEGENAGKCVELICDSPYKAVAGKCILDDGTCVGGESPDLTFCGKRGFDWGWQCVQADADASIGSCEKTCDDPQHYDLVDEETTSCKLKSGFCKKVEDCPSADEDKNWVYDCGEMVDGIGQCVPACVDNKLFFNQSLDQCIACDPAENDAATGYNARCDNGTYHTLPTCSADRLCEINCVAPYAHQIEGSTSCSLPEFKCTADDVSCNFVTNVSTWSCENIDDETTLGDCVGTCSKYLWQPESHTCGCAEGFYKDSSDATYGAGTENNGCVPNCEAHICSVSDAGVLTIRECRLDPSDTNVGRYKAPATCTAPANGSVTCDVQKGCVVSCNTGYDMDEETGDCVEKGDWTLITKNVPEKYEQCVPEGKTCNCEGKYFSGLTQTGKGQCSKLGKTSSPISFTMTTGNYTVYAEGYLLFEGNIFNAISKIEDVGTATKYIELTLSDTENTALKDYQYVNVKFDLKVKAQQHKNIGVVLVNANEVVATYTVPTICSGTDCKDMAMNEVSAVMALPEAENYSLKVRVFTFDTTVTSATQQVQIHPINVYAKKEEAPAL